MNAAGGRASARKRSREWFDENRPQLGVAVALTEKHPVIAGVLESNFGK